MIPIPAISLRSALRVAGVLAFALILAWALRLDHLRDGWRARFLGLQKQAATVLIALDHASGDKGDWATAPGRIVALGESNRSLKAGIETQNRTIADMAREAVRLKARAAELKAIADKAEAQRRAALTRLSDMSITPGTRSDCMILLREAEEAIDLVREAGA